MELEQKTILSLLPPRPAESNKGHYGKLLFEVFKYLGIADIAYNRPKTLPYPTENPWA